MASPFSVSNSVFSDVGGAVQDLFQGEATASADTLKAQGYAVEAQNYGMAATLAGQNEQFAAESTRAQQVQGQRQAELGIGTEEATMGGNGLALTGSNLDILRSAHQQAGIQQALIGAQGQITEAGYTEQQQAYQNMAAYSASAAQTEQNLASEAMSAGEVGAAFKLAAGVGAILA